MKNRIIEKVENALQTLKNGGLIIITDDENRESEGDMVGLAEYVTPKAVNTMVTNARGLLCVPMSAEIAQKLGLSPMVTNAEDAFGTAFTISTDAKTTKTGISAFDRAKTIQKLADPQAKFSEFYHPGHVFPLIAEEGGVLARGGHTEAAVDLAKLAGVRPVAYITEVLKKDGTMARRNTLKSLAEGMQMPLLTIEEIKIYRYMKDAGIVKSVAKVHLPTKYGEFEMEAFDTGAGQEPTLLLTKGNLSEVQPLLLRIHSECLIGDIFGSKRCDCGEQLERSLKEIQSRGRGALLYLRQEGRGIGLANKLKAYELQEQGMDTVEANLKLGFQADERHYGVAAAILRKKGVTKVNLLTNNPDKIKQLETLGIKVEERVTIQIPAHPENRSYLKVKKEKMHHLLKGMD